MIELRALEADITTLDVDAVVNAANAGLMGGAGVDGAIHFRGGPAILAECKEIVARRGPLATGDAVATTAGLLPARFVVHTVGPVWSGADPDGHDAQLTSCYQRSLDVAADAGATSVAFPCISTGLYGFPKDRAAAVALEAVRGWAGDHRDDPTSVRSVTFACFSGADLDRYRSLGVGG